MNFATDVNFATDLCNAKFNRFSGLCQDGNLTCWRQAHRQRRHIASQRPTQLHQRDESQVVFASFDPPDVTAIEPRFVRQPFLRQAKVLAPLAYALAKDVEIRVHTPKSLIG